MTASDSVTIPCLKNGTATNVWNELTFFLTKEKLTFVVC